MYIIYIFPGLIAPQCMAGAVVDEDGVADTVENGFELPFVEKPLHGCAFFFCSVFHGMVHSIVQHLTPGVAFPGR